MFFLVGILTRQCLKVCKLLLCVLFSFLDVVCCNPELCCQNIALLANNTLPKLWGVISQNENPPESAATRNACLFSENTLFQKRSNTNLSEIGLARLDIYERYTTAGILCLHTLVFRVLLTCDFTSNGLV